MASITNKVNTKVEVANEIKSFIGGMNTYATDDKLSDNEVRLIQNMELDNYGTAEKRVGLVFDSSKDFAFKDTDVNAITNISSIQGVFDFVEIIDGANVNIKIVIIGGKVYRKASNTTYSLLYPYLFDELTQKYNAANTSIDYYVNGFHNGKSTTATTFQANDCRPVTATYSKGVLLIATGWKLLEYGLFDNSEITGSGSTTKSYYLRQVRPKVPTTAQNSLYGGNLLQPALQGTDTDNDGGNSLLLGGDEAPEIFNANYSLVMLEYMGTPETGYDKYVIALAVEPCVKIGANFRYSISKHIEGGTEYRYTNSIYLSLTNGTSYIPMNDEFDGMIPSELSKNSELNNYIVTSENSEESNVDSVASITSIKSKPWYYAEKSNGTMFNSTDFSKYKLINDTPGQALNYRGIDQTLDNTASGYSIRFRTYFKDDYTDGITPVDPILYTISYYT